MNNGGAEEQDEITIKIKEVQDEPGKRIDIIITPDPSGMGNDYGFISDIRCLDDNTEKCDTCRLRFTCLTCDTLKIPLKDLGNFWEEPINKLVSEYLDAKKQTS